jgi:STE24 endopeptidase
MAQTVLNIFLVIIIAHYLIERFISNLNFRHLNDAIPASLFSIYSEPDYKRSQRYRRINSSFKMITSTFLLLLILVMIGFDGFAFVNRLALGISTDPVLSALIFFAVIFSAKELITFPFAIYKTFAIDNEHGENVKSGGAFILSMLKKWILGAVVGGGLIALAILLSTKTGKNFWLLAWVIVTVASLLFYLLYAKVIFPMVSRHAPLDEGIEKQAILDFVHRIGIDVDDVHVIQGNPPASNAKVFISGSGAEKSIVLYNSLLKDMTVAETLALVAHELGHRKKGHALWKGVARTIKNGLTLFAFSFFISTPVILEAFGVYEPRFHVGLIAFFIVYAPLSFLLGIVPKFMSRWHEYRADAYAASFGLANDLASALKKQSAKRPVNLTPHPLYVFFYQSQPSLLTRLKKLEKANSY